MIGKADCLAKGDGSRFLATNLPCGELAAQKLYEELYCAHGDIEFDTKDEQMYLFADQTSSGTLQANQLRLYFLALAQGHTIGLKLLKISAQVKISLRRIHVSFASEYT